MRRLLFGIAVTASLAAPGSGVAQVYPTRPITMVAPFPAGAPVDMVGRIVASACERRSTSQSSSRT
jgi:tripartite-type tricarboxylate transporter receptor subunit TctC